MDIRDITYTEKKATRDGFGEGLLELGQKNSDVVALTADLLGSLKMDAFKKNYPERFVQMGIAEANMMCVAAGMATCGKIPFTGTFANFSTGRVYDFIRQSIAYSGKNVKICASHAGLTLGEDGATHQILEDVGMMRMLPGMALICPADANETHQATLAIGEHLGPVYLRFGRPSWPVFTPAGQRFEIGKAMLLGAGSDITLFACGHMVWVAVEAAKQLLEQGITAEVINVHTIKPLDNETILDSLSKTRCAVICEEHQINGGLGDAIAHICSQSLPIPLEFVAVMDTFGESGKPEELLNKYGLGVGNILEKAAKALKRKKNN